MQYPAGWGYPWSPPTHQGPERAGKVACRKTEQSRALPGDNLTLTAWLLPAQIGGILMFYLSLILNMQMSTVTYSLECSTDKRAYID